MINPGDLIIDRVSGNKAVIYQVQKFQCGENSYDIRWLDGEFEYGFSQKEFVERFDFNFWSKLKEDLQIGAIDSEYVSDYLLQEKVDQEVREYNSLPEGSEED